MRVVGIKGKPRVVVGPIMEAALRRMAGKEFITVKELYEATGCTPSTASYALCRCVLFGFAVRFREPKKQRTGSNPFRYCITENGFRYLDNGLHTKQQAKILRQRKEIFGTKLSPRKSGLPKARPVEEPVVE